MEHNYENVDARIRLNALDDDTRAVYMGEPASKHPNYDASVFVEAQYNEKTGEGTLFVPSANRLDWFKAEHPDGIVVTDAPTIMGRYFSIEARVYLNLDDLVANRYVAKTQYNGSLSDSFDLNACATRAKGRALRDIHFDIPRDAHIIPGWTHEKVVADDAAGSADALESGVSVKIMPMPNVPTFDDAQPSEPAKQEKPEAEKSKPEKDNADKPKTAAAVNKENTAQKKHPAPAKKDFQPAQQPPLEDVVEDRHEPVVEAPAKAEDQSETSCESNEEEPVGILAEATKAFPKKEDAENYRCRILNNLTVSEQPDTRLSYFAKKVVNGQHIADKQLGYACVIVANARGLNIGL